MWVGFYKYETLVKLLDLVSFGQIETYSTKFVEFPKILTLQFGQREVKRLRFFVDLWEVQKVVQPMGLHNIFQVVECSKKKRPLPMDLIKTITKVSI